MAKPATDPTTNDDGTVTEMGATILTRYARAHLDGQRDTDTERAHPELESLFYDVRSDLDFAKRWAS